MSFLHKLCLHDIPFNIFTSSLIHHHNPKICFWGSGDSLEQKRMRWGGGCREWGILSKLEQASICLRNELGGSNPLLPTSSHRYGFEHNWYYAYIWGGVPLIQTVLSTLIPVVQQVNRSVSCTYCHRSFSAFGDTKNYLPSFHKLCAKVVEITI